MTQQPLTTTAAARVLHLSPERVRAMCADGELHAQKWRGVWAIERESVLRVKYQKYYQHGGVKERR